MRELVLIVGNKWEYLEDGRGITCAQQWSRGIITVSISQHIVPCRWMTVSVGD